ncbi:MAG: TolC family protein [Bacteroidaceae bacterium]|nr:TolC family protein [Bacteroidaceae bacterium]
MIRFFFFAVCLVLSKSVPTLSQTHSTICLDELLNIHVYHTKNLRIQYNNYKNALLEREIFQKSLLPSMEISLMPISFNHSMRLLQSYQNGEYSNINEYSNTTSVGINISQFVSWTGGTFSVGSSLSYLSQFSSGIGSFSARPFYASYTQQLFGGRKSFAYRKSLSEQGYVVAIKTFCNAVAKEQQLLLGMFLDAYLAKQDIQYYARDIEICDTLVQYAYLRYELGKTTEYDRNAIELHQMDSQLNLQKAHGEYNRARRLLSEELNIPNLEIGELGDCYFPEEITIADALYHARQYNPVYDNLSMSRTSAEYNLYSERLQYRFNADISLSYGLNQYAHSLAGAYRNPSQQQAVAVSLRIPVFQWGVNKRRLEKARNEYKSLMLEQEKQVSAFVESIHQCVEEYNRNSLMLRISERRCTLAEKQYAFAIAQFATGKFSSADLSEAAKSRLRSKQEYTIVLSNLYRLYYELRQLSMYDFGTRRNIASLLKLHEIHGA